MDLFEKNGINRKETEYKKRVEVLIRERYSLADELAIHRQRDTKPDEWYSYNLYCEECKRQAKAELGL